MARKPDKDEKRKRRAAEAFAALLTAARRGQGRGTHELVDAWRGLDAETRDKELSAVQEAVAAHLAASFGGKVDGALLDRWISMGDRAPEIFGDAESAVERWWTLLRACLLRRSNTLARRAWRHLEASAAGHSPTVHALIDALVGEPDGARDLSGLSSLMEHLPTIPNDEQVPRPAVQTSSRAAEVSPELIAHSFAAPRPDLSEIRLIARRAHASHVQTVWETVAAFALRHAIRCDDEHATALFIEALEKASRTPQLQKDLATCLGWLGSRLQVGEETALAALVRLAGRAQAWGMPIGEALVASAFEVGSGTKEGCQALAPLLTQTLVRLSEAHIVGREPRDELVRVLVWTSVAADFAGPAAFDKDVVVSSLHRVLGDVFSATALLRAALEAVGGGRGMAAVGFLLETAPIQALPRLLKQLVALEIPYVHDVLVEDMPVFLNWIDLKATWPQLTDLLVRDFDEIHEVFMATPGMSTAGLTERKVIEQLDMCSPVERPLIARPLLEFIQHAGVDASHTTLALWAEIGPALLARSPLALRAAIGLHPSDDDFLDDGVRALQHFETPEDAFDFLQRLDDGDLWLSESALSPAQRMDLLDRRFPDLPRLWHRLFKHHMPCSCDNLYIFAQRLAHEDKAAGEASQEARDAYRIFPELVRIVGKLPGGGATSRRATRSAGAGGSAPAGRRARSRSNVPELPLEDAAPHEEPAVKAPPRRRSRKEVPPEPMTSPAPDGPSLPTPEASKTPRKRRTEVSAPASPPPVGDESVETTSKPRSRKAKGDPAAEAATPAAPEAPTRSRRRSPRKSDDG